MKRRYPLGVAAAALALVSIVPANFIAQAASHRDSPLITEDPTVDQNDLYAFVSNNDAGQAVLNVIATYLPNEEPASGPNYYKFSDDALYQINIEGAKNVSGTASFTGKPDMYFNFRFNTHYLYDQTFLTYGIGVDNNKKLCVGPIQTVGDCRQNLQQTYDVNWTDVSHHTTTDISKGMTLTVPPNNIGKTTPLYNVGASGDNPAMQGAQKTSKLDPYTQQSIYTVANGIKVFAGQRLDGFYADLTGAFDGLNVRDAKTARNALKGFNTQAIAMQIPILGVLKVFGTTPVVGVWTTSYRHNVYITPTGNKQADTTWHQVGRMANPLFNEVFDPLAVKDLWQRSTPATDAQFMQEALNPMPAFLLNAVYPGVFKCKESGRTDLAGIFIPDVLKVDLSTGPVPLQPSDSKTFSRLSFLGGDTIKSNYTNTFIPSGWPNGRRLADDVIDIGLSASCGSGTLIGDSVNSNDSPYNHVFPFAQTPANGRNHAHDGI